MLGDSLVTSNVMMILVVMMMVQGRSLLCWMLHRPWVTRSPGRFTPSLQLTQGKVSAGQQHNAAKYCGAIACALAYLTTSAEMSRPSLSLTPAALPSLIMICCTSADVTTAPPAASTLGIMAAAMLLAAPAGTYAPGQTGHCTAHTHTHTCTT